MPVRRPRVRHCLLAAGVLVTVLLLAPKPAKADVGIESIKPSVGSPGDTVEVTVGCGFCFPPCSETPRGAKGTCMPSRHARPPEKYSFPIFLVPIEHRLAPHPCRGDALCAPTSVGRPRGWPFIYLGRALPAFGCGDLERTGAIPRYRLSFAIPAVKPGLYHLVIYSGPKSQRGSLIADAGRWRVRVRRAEAATATANGGDAGAAAWIGPAGALALLSSGLLYRRRAGTRRRAVTARSTSR